MFMNRIGERARIPLVLQPAPQKFRFYSIFYVQLWFSLQAGFQLCFEIDTFSEEYLWRNIQG